jgi:hypothetical protein
MIDLLINMSEIYGQPNGNNTNNIRTIDDEDEDEEYLNDERENLNDERENLNDDDNEQHEWNIEAQTEDCDDEHVQINGLRSITEKQNEREFLRSFRYNTHD